MISVSPLFLLCFFLVSTVGVVFEYPQELGSRTPTDDFLEPQCPFPAKKPSQKPSQKPSNQPSKDSPPKKPQKPRKPLNVVEKDWFKSLLDATPLMVYVGIISEVHRIGVGLRELTVKTTIFEGNMDGKFDMLKDNMNEKFNMMFKHSDEKIGFVQASAEKNEKKIDLVQASAEKNEKKIENNEKKIDLVQESLETLQGDMKSVKDMLLMLMENNNNDGDK